MTKPKKNKKSKLPKIPIPSFIKRNKSIEEKVSDAISDVPRITNDTVADHREDVLSSARKYIYPLQHSKHSIVRISLNLLVVVILAFFAFCIIDLYKFQDTGGFIYDVTKIVPFPVAKEGNSWVSYESYLFELRRNMHYYATQQQAVFTTKSGKLQLDRLKTQALNTAVENDLVKQLAKKYNVTVSSNEVNNELNLVKSENRLGSSNQVFKEVISQYYGWNMTDFKTELQQQLLQQAVVAKLDSEAWVRAQNALNQINKGATFSSVAQAVSNDASTSGNGGAYPTAISINDQQISPIITSELFLLKPGQVSPVINTGFTLEIVKVLDRTGTSLHAAHIQINLQSINNYINPIKQSQKLHKYININT
jgi:hypothetical protein